MSPLFWITGLLFVGLFVMVLEVFIPSGGLLGFVSIAAIVAAIATMPVRHCSSSYLRPSKFVMIRKRRSHSSRPSTVTSNQV